MAPLDVDSAGSEIPAVLRRIFANVGGNGDAPAAQPAAAPSANIVQPQESQTGLPDSITSTLPWMPQYRQAQAAQPARPALTTATGQMVPGSNTAQKLQVLLKGGLEGALAGRAASEQAVVQSGGRRSGGAGLGFMAGLELPAQQTQQQQTLQRGGLENQQLQQQVQAFPQTKR